MRESLPTGFYILVVLWDKADKGIARLVQSRTGWPRMAACTVNASNSVRALVERVLSSSGPTVVTQRQRLQMWVGCVVGAYLDGGNRVGKIPP